MTNSNYERGRSWEYTVIVLLRENGWTTLRSAGSHTKIDILAGKFKFNPLNTGNSWRLLAIQCKIESSPFTEKDKEDLMRAATQFHAIPILASRKGRKREFWTLDETNDQRVDSKYFI